MAIAGAVVALAVALWWVNGARTYAGLEKGSMTYFGDDSERVQGDGFGPSTIIRKPFRGGQTSQYGTTIRNGGDRAVKITGVGPQAVAPEFQLSVADVKLGGELGAAGEKLEPFRGVKLEPGGERYFLITFRLPGCAEFEPGSALRVETLEVRYSSLSFDKVQHIELDSPLEFLRGRDC